MKKLNNQIKEKRNSIKDLGKEIITEIKNAQTEEEKNKIKETNNKSKKNKSEIQIEHIEPNLDLYIGKLISTEFGNARITNVEKHNNKLKVTYSLTKSNEIKFELFNSIAELEREIEHATEKSKNMSVEKLNDLLTKIKI